jgi:hypothetical protein
MEHIHANKQKEFLETIETCLSKLNKDSLWLKVKDPCRRFISLSVAMSHTHTHTQITSSFACSLSFQYISLSRTLDVDNARRQPWFGAWIII